MRLILLLNVIVFFNIVYSSKPKIDPLVRIDQGLVRGQLYNGDYGQYTYFMGIPYAVVNSSNPFGESEPHPGFGDEIFNAYTSAACPQEDKEEFALDCLNLNVFVPFEATSKKPLPVLVWIHGGRFAVGQASQYDPKYLMKQGIVVVTINYRLGPYGFMCLDTPSVPGNQGLKDQHEALRWIRNNIAAFGGNPYEVTIAGQSAGSSSALLHLFSPKEKLFKKVIAQSGTPLSFGMFIEADTQAAIKIAGHLGFNTTDTEEALKFLTQSSTTEVISAFNELALRLRPCKERSFSGVENFVETSPYFMTNEKKIRNTPILIGHNTNEEDKLIRGSGDEYFNSKVFHDRLPEIFDLDEENLSEAADLVKHFYIGDEAISRNQIHELTDFESDFILNYPIQSIITKLLKENASPTYMYVFGYLGDTNYSETSHGGETSYLLDVDDPFFDVPSNTDDSRLMIERITTMWANFIKFGNPIPNPTELLPVAWEPVSEQTRPYMLIDKEMQMKSRVFHDRMAFWDLFYDKYASNRRLARECTIKHRDLDEADQQSNLPIVKRI